MTLKKEYNTPRKQFEALDNLNCFMATFYTLEGGFNIDGLDVGDHSTEVARCFLWGDTEEGRGYWSKVDKRLEGIVFH